MAWKPSTPYHTVKSRKKGGYTCPAMRCPSNQVVPARPQALKSNLTGLKNQPVQWAGLGVGAVGEPLATEVSSPPRKAIRKRSRYT
jgi:hypothetical protein